MADITRATREQALNRRAPLQDMSDEELGKLISQKKQEQTMQGIGGVASQTGGTFLGLAGVPQQSGPSPIDELAKIQALQLKQSGEDRKAKMDALKLEEQQNKLAEQKRINEAQEQIKGGTTPDKTTITKTKTPVVSEPKPTGQGPIQDTSGRIALSGFLPQQEFELKVDPKTGLSDMVETDTSKKARDVSQKTTEEVMKAEIGINKKQSEELSKKYGQAARFVGAMTNLNSQFKRADAEFGGTGGRAAITLDLSRLRYAPNFIKKAGRPLAAADAQAAEVTISALPILSGQARYVQGLANMVAKTVPDISAIPETRNDLIAQSVKNMVTILFAIENGFMTERGLRDLGINPDSQPQSLEEAMSVIQGIQLTPEQQTAVDQAVTDVLNTPAALPSEAFMDKKEGVTSSGNTFKRI